MERVRQAEASDTYGGWLVLTMREGDVLVIGDAVVSLKSIKSHSKAAIAVMAKRTVLVRKLPDKEALRAEEAKAKV